jgi:hypothetical protein
MGKAAPARFLVAPSRLSAGSTAGGLRTLFTAIDVAPVAVAADHHLAATTGTVEQTRAALHRLLRPMRAGLKPNPKRYSPVGRVSHGLGARHRADCGGQSRCRAFLNGPDDLTDSAQPVTSLRPTADFTPFWLFPIPRALISPSSLAILRTVHRTSARSGSHPHFVCAFECEADAERFYRALGSRLESFGLEVAAEKTNLLRFSRQDWHKNGSFEFLGFEFRWGRGRWGKPALKRRTARTKYRAALASFQAWCREHCRMRKDRFFAALNAKLRGYYNYYGIRGNFDSIDDFFYHVTRTLYRLLNRRSQRRSYNWKGFAELIKVFKLERPHICHSF